MIKHVTQGSDRKEAENHRVSLCRRFTALAAGLSLILSVLCMPAAAGGGLYLQTEQHSAYISGVTSTSFQPDGLLSRAQAAQLLYNLLTDKSPGSIDVGFSDAASGAWYYNAVTTLASYGVLNGYADGSFRPNNGITRAEFIKIIVAITGTDTDSVSSAADFSDVSSSHWAYAFIRAAAAQGWIGGYRDGTFRPDSGITRAEAVTVLNRVLGRQADTDAVAQSADAQKFSDVLPNAWYYGAVMEAAIAHTYNRDADGETWLEYDRAAPQYSGWQKLDGVWYYYDADGIKQTGWQKVNGVWYYLGTNGVMCTGWQQVGGTWYYLDTAGAMQTGWLQLSGKWYYLAGGGAMQTGFVTVGGYTYYCSDSGVMQTGWQQIGGAWYYFKSGGSMVHDDWLSYNGEWYYLQSDGVMAAAETLNIGGTVYSFNADGTWVEALQQAVESTAAAQKTTQLVVVIDHNLTFWQKDSSGHFIKKLDTYCGYGSNGLAAADTRVEGSKTTPIGAFPLLTAFGTGTNPGTAMSYRQITANSYWSAEQDDSYNTWVESYTTVYGEHLIDYYQYKYAIAVGFNTDPTVIGRGSAIFLHCKSTDHWSTGGCVSVQETELLWLIRQLQDGAYIVIVPDQSSLAYY